MRRAPNQLYFYHPYRNAPKRVAERQQLIDRETGTALVDRIQIELKRRRRLETTLRLLGIDTESKD